MVPPLDLHYGLETDAFERLRLAEFPQLSGNALDATTYLDHAGSPPHAQSVLQAFAQDISQHLYANPHSRSLPSQRTTDRIEVVRHRTLRELFNLTDLGAKDWDLIFTSGATASLRLVAQAFAFGPTASYTYVKEAHTSLVGIRPEALRCGATVEPISLAQLPTWLDGDATDEGLFAYPAQCNATGQRISLDLCRLVKRRHSHRSVLIDAAAHLATSQLDLSSLSLADAPDFVVGSFYKIYGYPTGLGFLLVKRASGERLRKAGYFGGGAIDGLLPQDPTYALPRTSSLHERFEDGTLPFLDIIALDHAMDVHHRLFRSLDGVAAHTNTLTCYVRPALLGLRHPNGRIVVTLHDAFSSSPVISANRGPTLAMTLYRADGSPVGHIEFERLAAINGFSLRAGGLCNTGALATAFDLDDATLVEEFGRGRTCWDEQEFTRDGRPLGWVRISWGATTSLGDLERFVAFVERYYVAPDLEVVPEASVLGVAKSGMRIGQVTIYPIKSCAGYTCPSAWPVKPFGLLYDRQWLLIDPGTGRALSQKRHTRMALVRPRIDLVRRLLLISWPGAPQEYALPLDEPTECAIAEDARVCADTVGVVRPQGGDANLIDEALSSFLEIKCSLRALPSSTASRFAHGIVPTDPSRPPPPILLSNESPFLLIAQSSLDRVNGWLENNASVSAAAFRANFLLTGSSTAFVEDDFDLVRIGDQVFQLLATCRRCQMICIDQKTAKRQREPLSVLSLKRRDRAGHVMFGVHLMHRPDLSSAATSACVGRGDLVEVLSTRRELGPA